MSSHGRHRSSGFEVLTLVRVGVLRSAGVRLEPTGRNPRHFTVAGLGWSTLADAHVPERVPGAMLLAGNHQAQAVVRVVTIDEDGQIHFSILPGSVAKNRHLLDRTVA